MGGHSSNAEKCPVPPTAASPPGTPAPGGGPPARPPPLRGGKSRPKRPAPGPTDVAPAAGKIEFLGALRLLGAFRELLPRRENLQQDGQNDQGQREQAEGVEQPLDPPELHLVRRESPEALGEHLPADPDVPPGGEDPPRDEDQGDEVKQLPKLLAFPKPPEDLDGGEERTGKADP